MASIVAVAMGLALPWGKFSGPYLTERLHAFDLDDGVVIGLTVMVAAALFLLRRTGAGRWAALGMVITGGFATVVSLVDAYDIASTSVPPIPELEIAIRSSLGPGIVLTGVGCVAMTVAGVVLTDARGIGGRE